MNADRTSRAIAALATPHARALLDAIRDAEWYIASAAAARAKVHVSTASKHLAVLHEAGLLQRKEVRTATGRTFAYRLPRPTVTLTLDLASHRGVARTGGARAALDLLRQVVRKGEAMAGPRVRARAVEILEATWPDERLRGPNDDVEVLLDRLAFSSGVLSEDRIVAALRGIREFLDATLGPLVSDQIVLVAVDEAGGRQSFPWLSKILLSRTAVMT